VVLLFFLVERMCKGKKWPVVRLDGSLAVKKRMELVNAFNDEKNRNAFCFLLSSKVINKWHCPFF
jgi:SNF2 family DNA or RNA helicase